MKDGIYPRPNLVRKSYIDLDGTWDFKEVPVKEEINTKVYDEKIEVPYPAQSALSMINREIHETHFLVYRRFFDLNLDDIKEEEVLVLHFGAINQTAKIYFNGRFVKFSGSGYHHINIEIPKFYLKETNEIEVVCRNYITPAKRPYGNQWFDKSSTSHGLVSGIWQNVWAEIVPNIHVTNIKISTDLKSAEVLVFTSATSPEQIVDTYVKVDNEKYQLQYVKTGKTVILKAIVTPIAPINWTPEKPYLYDMEICVNNDSVRSYFGLRTIHIDTYKNKQRILLNDKPYFFNGVLDNGYNDEGMYTPNSLNDYESDIWLIKNMGFNTVRKHRKIEPDYFYYLCDKLGLIVFQDMVSNGAIKGFQIKTIQSIGVGRTINDVEMNPSPEHRSHYLNSLRQTVLQLYNFPSVCYYTLFDEGRGQFDGGYVYDYIKKLDSSRIVDTASGWFKGAKSDVISEHTYLKKFKIDKHPNKPVILSRFGGYYHKAQGYERGDKAFLGIGWCKTRRSFNKTVKELYKDDVVSNIPNGLCGAIYANFADWGIECNGLMTSDRAMCKIDSAIKIKI